MLNIARGNEIASSVAGIALVGEMLRRCPSFSGIDRLRLRNGQPLLIPEEELECWWMDLDCNAGTCVRLYHAHGTSKQFHAELKSDMRVERLPSGKLRSNSVMLSCALLAFNCLRRLGGLALRHDRTRRATPRRLRKRARMRARTVIDTLLRVAGRVVSHAGRTVLKLGRNFRGFDRFLWISRRCCLQ